jgi:hypothetical protein
MLYPPQRSGNGRGEVGLRFKSPSMIDPESRGERRDRQQREIEESQRRLRESIANTERLLDQSDDMLKRHRTECDEADPD